MLPKQKPANNFFGKDVSKLVTADVPEVFDLPENHRAVWRLASPHLRVRNNDAHTLYSYGIAKTLLEVRAVAGRVVADREVTLIAMLLHDTGWSKVPETEVLQAIAPGSRRPDIVLKHEEYGAEIATQILTELGYQQEFQKRVIEIILGHDSTREARSEEDAIVKDSDKLWRLTTHGVDTIMDWFGLTREQSAKLISSRVHENLLTDEGKVIGLTLAAIASIDVIPERLELG